MNRLSTGICAGLVLGLGCASSAFAGYQVENPLGFYFGAGVGGSNVRGDNDPYFGYPGYYNGYEAAWKVMAGIRPIPPIGAEIEYIDFGNSNNNGNGYYSTNYYYGQSDHPTAGAAFALGYLPIPLPFLDIYGKAGVARLHSEINGYETANCNPSVTCSPNGTFYRNNQWNTDFAYGAGVQAKFGPGLALRAEYERISQTGGDPAAVTVGVTWTF
jgi:Outer membrane protein beta-barrel domain